ncbi:cytochrome P450 [Actinoplanes sp. NPDC049265]|uniref:cytochrome P450 n=1 Tax=Actinoplanes sp. NPDC049265 TaxID=3363902 RepID=UPI00371FE520
MTELGDIVGASSDVDLWSDDVLNDPYPTYRQLRDQAPAVWLAKHSMVALPRFSEVREALTDWRTFSSATGVGVDPGFNAASPPNILKSDPPEHTSFRRPLVGHLSSRGVAAVAPRVERTAAALVDDVVERDAFDVVTDLARPYGVSVLCDLLGIDERGRENLSAWGVESFNQYGPAGERSARGMTATQNLIGRIAELAQPGRVAPDGWAAELAAAGSFESLAYYVFPGIDTTVNALSAALYLFGRHPEQWQRLRDDRSLIPAAFNEVIRMHTPVHYFTRTTTAAVDVGGVEIPPRTRVLLMYGSANRDERQFADPDRFDVTRDPRDHLAFGRGVHLCAGANLATLEGQSLIAALAERVRKFDLVSEPAWLLNHLLHGLRGLTVRALL